MVWFLYWKKQQFLICLLISIDKKYVIWPELVRLDHKQMNQRYSMIGNGLHRFSLLLAARTQL